MVKSLTTRFGYQGDDSGGPPKEEAPRGAKTVFGRDFHRPNLNAETPGQFDRPAADSVSVDPHSAELRRMAERSTQLIPDGDPRGAPGQSQFPDQSGRAQGRGAGRRGKTPSPDSRKRAQSPRHARKPSVAGRLARAGFFGRRDTQGDLVPVTEPTDIMTLPREPWVKPAITVFIAAVCSFLVVAVIMWIAKPAKPARPEVRPAVSSSGGSAAHSQKKPENREALNRAVDRAQGMVPVAPPTPTPQPSLPPTTDDEADSPTAVAAAHAARDEATPTPVGSTRVRPRFDSEPSSHLGARPLAPPKRTRARRTPRPKRPRIDPDAPLVPSFL